MNYSFDYESVYQTITSKLKKRIFKKPNYIEASESLNTIIKLMSEEECPEYAGVFYLSKARCESTSKNILDEANCLILAGENFFKAEKKLKGMQIKSVEDFLETGTMCYMYSIGLYIEASYPHLALSNGMHLAQMLREFKNYNDAINVYNLLLSVANLDLPQQTILLHKKGQCLVQTRNFKSALKTYVEIIDKMKKSLGSSIFFGHYRDTLEEAEIYRVLLILICQSHELKSKKESLSLNDYKLENVSLKPLETVPILLRINQEVFYHFISLITTVQNQTHRAAERVAMDLQSYFTDDQNDLVREIVNELINPSGEAF